MILQSVLLVLLLTFRNTFAQTPADFLLAGENDPAAMFEHVALSNGAYHEVVTDAVIPGPDRLEVYRCYSSWDVSNFPKLGRWAFFPHCFLVKTSKPAAQVYIAMKNGAILPYTGSQEAKTGRSLQQLRLDKEAIAGMSNTSRGEICSFTNLKNSRVDFEPSAHKATLYLPDGTVRLYERHVEGLYLLKQEMLPSKNITSYEYNEKGFPIRISLSNGTKSKVLSWITIDYADEICIHTSDQQTIRYQFTVASSGKEELKSVFPSLIPEIQYGYSDGLLVRKIWPEGRFIDIQYTEEEVPKVSSISYPYGQGDVAHVRLKYQTDAESSVTELTGPLAQRKTYQFDAHHRLVAVSDYLNGELYRIERKAWGAGPDLGNLKTHSLEDASGNVFYLKQLIYNDTGNILQECTWGNLTGSQTAPIKLDANGAPQKGQECHTRKYTYSQTKNYEIVNQEDEKGTLAKTYYRKGTDRLVKQTVSSSDKLGRRQRYYYNEDGALNKIVIDDSRETATRVYPGNFQRIISITPKETLPNVGAPVAIEETDIREEESAPTRKMVYQYDPFGNVISQTVYDTEGKEAVTLKWQYADGRLVSETTGEGHTTTYAYDTFGNLISATDEDLQVTYTYDIQNNLVAITESASDTAYTTLSAYDALGRKIVSTDWYGNQTRYAYDDLGRLTSVMDPELQDRHGDTVSPTSTFEYDLFDHVIGRTAPNGAVTKQVNTILGAPARIWYPDKTQELFKYDLEGSLHRYCHRNGVVDVIDYDGFGRVSHIKDYGRSKKGAGVSLSSNVWRYDAFGHLSSNVINRNRAKYAYDNAGHLSDVDGDTGKVAIRYNSKGQPTTIKTWQSEHDFFIEKREYDTLGNLALVEMENTSGELLIKQGYQYDKQGRLTTLVGYPNNRETPLLKQSYDPWGRIIQTATSDGVVTEVDYIQTTNQLGQMVPKQVIRTSAGQRLEAVQDSTGRLNSLSLYDNDTLLTTTKYSVDQLGLPWQTNFTSAREGNLNAPASIYREYDQAGHLQSIKLSGQPDGTRYAINQYGELSSVHPNGESVPILYKYDGAGRLSSVSHEGNAPDTRFHYRFEYDGAKQCVMTIEDGETVDWEMGQGSHLKRDWIQDAYGQYQVTTTSNKANQITTITLPDQTQLIYRYNGPFVQSVTRERGQDSYTYQVLRRDLMGNIMEERFPEKAGSQIYEWDQSGRKIGVVTNAFTDRIPSSGFDRLGRIQKRTVQYGEDADTILYRYDDLSQLVEEEGPRNAQYAYDGLGNRLRQDEAAEQSGQYDERGFLTTKRVNGEIWTFTHNALGQLVRAEGESGAIVRYRYDPEGRRLSKTFEANGAKSIRRYFYLGMFELGCIDEKGDILELRIPKNPNAPSESECIACELHNRVYVPTYDLQGNLVSLMDPNTGDVEESYRYTAFGEMQVLSPDGKTISRSSLGNPWVYRGHRLDVELSLIQIGYRNYDPKMGRFITPDPAGPIDSPNLYLYCFNNPLSYRDRFGLSASPVDEAYFYSEPNSDCVCGRYGCSSADAHRSTPWHLSHKRGAGLNAHPFGGAMQAGIAETDIMSGGGPATVLAIQALMHHASNPYFHGGMQVFAGLFQMAGAGISIAFTNGAATPLAWGVFIHGVDHFATGMRALFTGELHDSLTVQALGQLGVPYSIANTLDTSVAVAGSLAFAAPVAALNLGCKSGAFFGKASRFRLHKMMPSSASINIYRSAHPVSPLKNTVYTPKVLRQMQPNISTGLTDFHGFPRIVDNYAGFGVKSSINSRDGLNRMRIRLKGGYKGKEGCFEWIIESNQSVNHRIFIPK